MTLPSFGTFVTFVEDLLCGSPVPAWRTEYRTIFGRDAPADLSVVCSRRAGARHTLIVYQKDGVLEMELRLMDDPSGRHSLFFRRANARLLRPAMRAYVDYSFGPFRSAIRSHVPPGVLSIPGREGWATSLMRVVGENVPCSFITRTTPMTMTWDGCKPLVSSSTIFLPAKESHMRHRYYLHCLREAAELEIGSVGLGSKFLGWVAGVIFPMLVGELPPQRMLFTGGSHRMVEPGVRVCVRVSRVTDTVGAEREAAIIPWM